MKNKKIIITGLIIVITVSSVYIVSQLFVKDMTEGKVSSNLEENIENILNTDGNKENLNDVAESDINSVVVNENDLKELFLKDNQDYLFSAKVLNQLEGSMPLTYNLNLTAKFSPDTTLNLPLIAVSNVGTLNVGEYYRLYIKYDSNLDKYIVTGINAYSIYD